VGGVSLGPFRLALVSYAYDRSEVEEARLIRRGKYLAPGGPVPRVCGSARFQVPSAGGILPVSLDVDEMVTVDPFSLRERWPY
jgi:hypothetical protein